MDEPKRIMFLGDTHGNTVWTCGAIGYAAENGCDTIVQVGDFGHWTPGASTKSFLLHVHKALEEHGITLYWVDGNHEDHADIQERLDGHEAQPLYGAYPRIVYLPRGFRWEWWGKMWMSLGGAASVDRLTRTPGKSWWPGELLSDEDVEHASRPGKVDVIVSHDCPFGVDIPKIGTGSHPNTDSGWPMVTLIESAEHRRKVRQVVEAVKPTLLVHGHFHLRYQSYLDASHGRVLIQGLDCDGSPKECATLFLNAPGGC